MRTQCMVLVLCFLLTACSSGSKAYPPSFDSRMGSVTAQDFFFFSCVRQYMEINSIKVFDGSVAYAVEYSNVPSKDLDRIYKSAKRIAKTIPKPNYQDQEHGLPAVLVLCQKESNNEENRTW